MKNKPLYFDYASTTKIRQEVYEAMLPYLQEEFGNPSSLYTIGIRNKKIINQCRKTIASLINAESHEIYFCSGGSEANNWAIKGVAFAHPDKREIITTKIEHPSVLNSCRFLEKLGYIVTYLDVDAEGFVNLQELEDKITDNTCLVSIMTANNEIGTIQDIQAIGEICTRKGVLFHTDAIQAISHLPIDVKQLKIDLLSFSAHKFYGPKGIGCLYISKNTKIENLIHGGNQEREKRAGTENVAYIVGMAKAIELSYREMYSDNVRERDLSQLLYHKLKDAIPDMRLNGPEIGNRRLPGNLNISFKHVDGSQLCFELNEEGICVSTGSACHSDMIEPSHVLQAIKVPDDYIKGTIRITIGKDTTEEEIDKLTEAIIKRVKK